ncbi:class I SAM-dependent methyltransferase [Pseudorhodoplanes sp.]|uniref:class I SAM-dependent methyltransferase n=1 Tax=Pseudorhodoplanes sp. TaxID=1934341 RepID=UPI002C94912F|nr:class I SAM-dependent methyltransferase [Pseudorhodoplanes sp.]HWV44114.1 class I SAM-dependent methyltransferase [Pseudorhodoplanes sp.]
MTERLHRRVAGHHDIRLDGLTDLLLRAPGASVLDIGCNRGLVGFEFFANGASKVHGVDIYAEGIETARHLFCDLRNCESRFEVRDLTKPDALDWCDAQYTIVVMLATYHKLKRVMSAGEMSALIGRIGRRTGKYFAWRATSFDHAANEEEMRALDRDLGLKRVHTSYLSKDLGVAAIWERK